MNEIQARQATFDLVVTCARLSKFSDTIEEKTERKEFFNDLHGEVLQEYGH